MVPKMVGPAALAWVVTLLFAAAAHAAEKKCQLTAIASLPVTMSGTRPLISGTINGQPARFLADSGAFFSVLWNDTAAKYDLRVGSMPPNMRVRGTGGSFQAGVTRVKEFTLAGFLGGRVNNDVQFIVSANIGRGDIAGIIGQNVLGIGDSEYDLANGAIRVIDAKNCRGNGLAYWATSQPVAEMEVDDITPAMPNLIGRAKLNGKTIRIVFDSGAGRSILTRGAAARAGIEPQDDEVTAAGISRGLGAKSTENSLARFDTLDLGGEVIKNAKLRIGTLDLDGLDMLLGADFFLSHRIYVASKQNKIYFTYNGGPVFDLRGSQSEAKTQPAILETAPAGPSASAPALNSAALRRRGTASAGRRDFDAAIADFDRAIELDAADPENFYERGLALWQSGQPRRAFADFNKVIELEPDHAEALLARGTLRLRGGNDSAATADFQRALTLSPIESDLGLRVAAAYQGTGKYARAIEQLDVWVAAHPKDDRLADALSQRCTARALSKQDLDVARADCDTALKKGPKNSALYASRGIVWLQLGDVDNAIDDYKAALKLQPKHAPSLYGLGLAELRKGLKDSGNSHIQAALALNPSVADMYQRAELAP
jgi:tetratricopeptide (TPR) repeat protein/predicted aspartyl protease